jgi:hypothetical protein
LKVNNLINFSFAIECKTEACSLSSKVKYCMQTLRHNWDEFLIQAHGHVKFHK